MSNSILKKIFLKKKDDPPTISQNYRCAQPKRSGWIMTVKLRLAEGRTVEVFILLQRAGEV